KANRVVDDVAVGNSPSSLAVGEGAVWVLNGNDRTVSRIDPQTNAVRTISVGGNPADLTVGDGSVWVVDLGATVRRIDPQSGVVERTIRLPGHVRPGYTMHRSIASGMGAVWVSGWSPAPP